MANHKNRNNNLSSVVRPALYKGSEIELNEVQLNLLRLCRLIVDIEYKHRFANNPKKEAPSGRKN